MILVTGCNGVLGSAFKKINKKKDFYYLNGRKEVNLCSQNETSNLFKKKKFSGIIHLAAISGGLGLSGPKHQATLLRDNTLMLFNILDCAKKYKIKKVLLTLSSGMYPPQAKMPYKEEYIHNGPAHESSYGYFYSKRLFEPAIKAYRDQFNLNVIGCVPNGMYGENDNFSEFAPMLPSIIKRAIECKKEGKKLVVWGDGSALREYTFSEDMANAFLWCFKNYSSEKIINIGSDEERKIKEIVFYVAKAINLNLDQIMFDKTKPKGVHKKSMSNKNFIKISKFKFLPLKDGIKKTINWYIKNYDKIKLKSKI